jgi:hypothetical protein
MITGERSQAALRPGCKESTPPRSRMDYGTIWSRLVWRINRLWGMKNGGDGKCRVLLIGCIYET